jgi:hypothetical protein
MELQIIQSKIFAIRGRRVMTDFHLAELYQIETRALKQAVKRNIERFPDDFMFSLTEFESKSLIDIGVSQNVIPPGYNVGNTVMLVFTEQGIAMLSSILRSKTAIHVNISIMRAFVLMRQMVIDYEELRQRIEQLEISSNAQFSEIYRALTELLSKKEDESKPRNPVGYLSYNKDNQ